MPLSISSSEQGAGHHHRWWLVLVLAMTLALSAITVLERYRRAQGHLPTVIDSPALWALQRSAADGEDAVIFLGASRSLFGIDLATVKEMLPGRHPVMLALNGRYPLATLGALAADDSVNGLLLVDIDARGMSVYNHDAQASHNAFYRDTFTPNDAIHTALLSPLQSTWVIANPRLGLLPLMKHVLGFAPPAYLSHERIDERRSGYLDFERVSGPALADSFAAGLREDLASHPPAPPIEWMQVLSEVPQWVRAIEARGGRVVFYVPPVSGRQRQFALSAYPVDDYWRSFIESHDLSGLHFLDSPALQQFHHPDESHIDYRQKRSYTHALLEALRMEGYL
jgi:hypothetical protein